MASAQQQQFFLEAFGTEVDPQTIGQFATAIEEIVRSLRTEIVSDDRLEVLLRSQPGREILRENDSTEHLDPEPLTQDYIIEPLLDLLGYDYGREGGGLSDRRGRQADYVIPLRNEDTISSSRLLIEAEPLNKRLSQDAHGLGQVKDWLAIDEFEADFGIATDGVRWILIKRDRDTYGYDTLVDVDLQPLFLSAFENLTGKQVSLSEWLDDGRSDVLANYLRGFTYENFVSIAGEAVDIIRETKEAITDEFYDDYIRLVFGIVKDEDERADRSLIGEGVIPPDDADGDDLRLFAVTLMDRLIFIKFLEDKRLVDSKLLTNLAETHRSGLNPSSFYKTYLEPLFYGVLDERPSERAERIRQINLYSDVPYLNGGLFRATIKDGGYYDETEFDVRDSILLSIIDHLERYTFSSDGTPHELDPSILGHVFEKTINYITGTTGDEKRELGAYYTPDEITSFCAEETVQPALLDRFKTHLFEKREWPEAEIEKYDNVNSLIKTLPESSDLAEGLLAEINRFRALDPACGSGHFLTSVLSEIVEVRKGIYGLKGENPPTWKLRKETVIENIYGVDIVDPAVEIAKLRLWLSIISEVDPEVVEQYDEDELALPNVVFNIRQGNSLIGYTDLIETGVDEEQVRLDAWEEDTVRSMYGDIIAEVEHHKIATTTEKARVHLEQAESLLDDYRGQINRKVLTDFHAAGIDDANLEQVESYDPFHWVLEFAEVYADGGFDIVIGNPPWEQLQPSRDDFFSRCDPQFRTRMPKNKDEKQEELLKDPEIADAWEQHQEHMKGRAEYFKNSPSYELQSPEIDGRTVPSKQELSGLFLERIFSLVNEGGYVAQILPGRILNGTSGKALRSYLIDNATLEHVVGFENKGIFEDIDNRYNFAVVTFKTAGATETVRGIFQQHDLEILRSIDDYTIRIPQELLENFSPDVRIIPLIKSAEEVDVLRKLISHPPINADLDGVWKLRPYFELNRTIDRDRYVEDSDEGDYPVFGGSNINQFQHCPLSSDGIEPPKLWSVDEQSDPDLSAKRRIREKNVKNLKKTIFEAFDGSGSQKTFVDELLRERRGMPLSEDDVKLDCETFRIVHRDIARATDERTLIAAVIPPGIVCHDKLHTMRPYRINPTEEDLSKDILHSMYEREFSDAELFVALGLLNSLPFDYLIRRKTDTTIIMYKLKESPIPRLTDGDNWFHYISSRAARLNCYGDDFEEMRNRLGGIEPATRSDVRKRIRAEIDGAAFHAYGLNRDETEFVLNDFHQVRSPRMMTDDYFGLVLDKYDNLADSCPKA